MSNYDKVLCGIELLGTCACARWQLFLLNILFRYYLNQKMLLYPNLELGCHARSILLILKIAQCDILSF